MPKPDDNIDPFDAMAGNQAAWLDGANKELRVSSAEFPKPRGDEVVIRNFAVAVNPVDCTSETLLYIRGSTKPLLTHAIREDSGPWVLREAMAFYSWRGHCGRNPRRGTGGG